MAAFLQALEDGYREPVPLVIWDSAEVATLDQRHFRTVRPAHIEALVLLPEPR